MTVAFWTMIVAAVVWFLSSAVVFGALDSWGGRVVPVVYLSGVVGVAAAIVFVVLFGLDALGIAITITRQ